MKSNIINIHNKLYESQKYDNIVNICKHLVELLREVSIQLSDDELPEISAPNGYYKHPPHITRDSPRLSFREILNKAVNKETDDLKLKLSNIYVVVITGMYVYHMPVNELINLAESSKEITEDIIKEILLNDGMSPNWIFD